MTERIQSDRTNGPAPPLRGIRVIDYSHFLAGPFLSRCLAAMGAEVIKVERPTKGDAGRAHPYFIDGHSGYFLQQNMGKQGLCVNVRDPRGLELMHRLVDGADVFVENYRPGALDRLGLGYADLSERNPRLVYCSISAYGHSGPDSDNPGFGLIAEAKSGARARGCAVDRTAQPGHRGVPGLPRGGDRVDDRRRSPVRGDVWLRLARLIGGDELAADTRFHRPRPTGSPMATD